MSSFFPLSPGETYTNWQWFHTHTINTHTNVYFTQLQDHGQEVLQSLGQKCLAEVLKAENEQGSRNSSPASSIKNTGTNESQLSTSLGSYSSPQGKVKLSFNQRD